MGKNSKYDPGLVVWEITLNCNLKCSHCGSSAGTPRDNELTTEEGLQLCNDLSELDFKGVTLFGGEPFLRNDWSIFGKEIKFHPWFRIIGYFPWHSGSSIST